MTPSYHTTNKTAIWVRYKYRNSQILKCSKSVFQFLEGIITNSDYTQPYTGKESLLWSPPSAVHGIDASALKIRKVK